MPAGRPAAFADKIMNVKENDDAQESSIRNHVSGCSFGERDVCAPVEDSLVIGRVRKPLQPGGSLCKTVLLLSCFWRKVCDRSSAAVSSLNRAVFAKAAFRWGLDEGQGPPSHNSKLSTAVVSRIKILAGDRDVRNCVRVNVRPMGLTDVPFQTARKAVTALR
jgi:hypothetical protein